MTTKAFKITVTRMWRRVCRGLHASLITVSYGMLLANFNWVSDPDTHARFVSQILFTFGTSDGVERGIDLID